MTEEDGKSAKDAFNIFSRTEENYVVLGLFPLRVYASVEGEVKV